MKFATYNVVGAICWVTSMTLAGYALGNLVPNIEQNIHLVVAVVIALSLMPPAIAWFRRKTRRRAVCDVGAVFRPPCSRRRGPQTCPSWADAATHRRYASDPASAVITRNSGNS